ncbi:hypothetical protein CKO27_17535 [Thiocystis violacea]|nr:hypothetical protein [Thiocystis violacea]
MSAWIEQIFSSQQANSGNVVRRSIRDVEYYASIAELVDEVKARNYHLVRCGDQVVIICNNSGNIQILV